MEVTQLQQLISSMSASGLSELEYEENGVRLHLRKEKEPIGLEELPKKITEQVRWEQTTGTEEKRQEQEELQGNVVTSPLVGTFYAAPAEDAAPYVQVGDRVKKGQILGIVEAMKLMNEIESDCDGQILEILAENGKLVEYQQPLFRIKS
ncbi:acetyl-CoA carboxylase biotin carboxyl carrier protein [Clostridiaceae bacterium 68-1-5]|uniref:Biotin carboxyl carrier protein of acetyl-CoA carboxylase n=1 Tax=Suipraeoptans intestinalis TaxID=2606628 RepID=A0A6N7USE5_9FIRM|nr:acetyl-CoA carboxylase biotin carboxyl carrier protein [Suipraeoptans intestinalis]MSR93568.1 acetyl-CoA carboxylase biotin carboxyl carrier protein [Suipraeoptans intestinalis]